MSKEDRFYDLLDTLREGAYTAGTFALGALSLACEGAEKLAEGAKLRYEAARVEGEMDGKLQEAGKIVYATHSGNFTNSEELLGKLQEIDALKARLKELNEDLGRTAEDHFCPECGGTTKDGDHFCRSCGRKLD